MNLTHELPSSTGSFGDLFRWANETMGGKFGWGILASLWFIVFMYMDGQPKAKVTTATFITTGASYFVFLLDLVGQAAPLLLTVATAISIVMLYIEGRN